MLFIIVLCFAIFVFYVQLNKRYDYWKKRGVPFPKPTLILGNSGPAVSLNTSFGKILQNMYNNYENHSYVGFFNLCQPALLLRDHELIKEVLIKQFNKFPNGWIEVIENADPIVRYNPFVLRNDDWKIIRKQVNPQFSTAKIKCTVHLMGEVSGKMLEYIENQIKTNHSKTIRSKDLCARFMGESVFTCAYGLDGKSFEAKLPDSFKIIQAMRCSGFIEQFVHNMSIFLPFVQKIFNVTFLGKPVPKMFKTLILDAIQFREENNIERMDFLGFLKNLKGQSPPVSDDLLVSYAFTLFSDGFEASGIIFFHALLELAVNRAVQNAARTHIKAILEKHNGKIDYEALQEMKYMDNIILETVRKYAPQPFLSRVCKEECVFPSVDGSNSGNDLTVEKGTQIFISVSGIHYDPKYYPDPRRFNPENFNEEAENNRPNYSFLGFGDGPRICLGKRFALAAIRMGLVTILNNYHLEVNENMRESVDIHLEEISSILCSPEEDMLLDFHPLISNVS